MRFVWGNPSDLRITLEYVGLRTFTTASATIPWATGVPVDRPKTPESNNPDGAVLAYRVGIAEYPPEQSLDFTHATVVMTGAYTAPLSTLVSGVMPYSPTTEPLYATPPPLAQGTTAEMPQGYGRQHYGDYTAPASTEVSGVIRPNPPIAPYTYIAATGHTITLPPDGHIKAHGEPVVSVGAEGSAEHGYGVVGAATVPVTAEGHGEASGASTVRGDAVVSILAQGFVAQGFRSAGVASVSLTVVASAQAIHAQGGAGAASVAVSASGAGQHGYRVDSAVPLQLIANGVAEHTRYEVRGHVNLTSGGLPLSRSVRACDRDTGELVAIGDSIGGVFHLHCGLAPAEYTIMVVDTDPAATDFAIPVTNRVVSVLARDAF